MKKESKPKLSAKLTELLDGRFDRIEKLSGDGTESAGLFFLRNQWSILYYTRNEGKLVSGYISTRTQDIYEARRLRDELHAAVNYQPKVPASGMGLARAIRLDPNNQTSMTITVHVNGLGPARKFRGPKAMEHALAWRYERACKMLKVDPLSPTTPQTATQSAPQ